MNRDAISHILFLCTGNYYRSRFAQAIFNDLAAKKGLHWRAFSRGLWLQPSINHGTLSTYTQLEMERRGLPLELAGDKPRELTEEDLRSADRIIALKEAEHRPLMRRDFPDWEDKVMYWKVHDLDAATAEEALPQIEQLVGALVDQLSSGQES